MGSSPSRARKRRFNSSSTASASGAIEPAPKVPKLLANDRSLNGAKTYSTASASTTHSYAMPDHQLPLACNFLNHASESVARESIASKGKGKALFQDASITSPGKQALGYGNIPTSFVSGFDLPSRHSTRSDGQASTNMIARSASSDDINIPERQAKFNSESRGDSECFSFPKSMKFKETSAYEMPDDLRDTMLMTDEQCLSPSQDKQADLKARTGSLAASPQSVDFSGNKLALQNLLAPITRLSCAACKAKLFGKSRTLESYMVSQDEHKMDPLDVFIRCDKCFAHTCAGCLMEKAELDQSESSTFNPASKTRCQTGCSILLWKLLCQYDMKERQEAEARGKAKNSHRTSAKKGSGVGYSTRAYSAINDSLSDTSEETFYAFGNELYDDLNESTPLPSWLDEIINQAPTDGSIAENAEMIHEKIQQHADSLPSGQTQHISAPFWSKVKQKFKKGATTLSKSSLQSQQSSQHSNLEVYAGAKSIHSSPTHVNADHLRDVKGKEKVVEAQNLGQSDAHFRTVLTVLIQLLPSHENKNQDHSDAIQALPAIIYNSIVIDKIADLFRNSSLRDITTRLELYKTALLFTQKLATHPTTASLISAERESKQDKPKVFETSFPVRRSSRRIRLTDKYPSIAICMQDLVFQSKSILLRAENNTALFDTARSETEDMLNICCSISELADMIPNVSAASATPEASRKNSSAWHRDFCIAELADDVILAEHAFKQQALSMLGKQPLRGRMKRLIEETTDFKISLPDGILVRHGTSRIDVMKFVIIGPVGTPYESGMFEFDLLCEQDYPRSPPRLQFKTTGGGRVGFNPNLYPCGKVCLSLINTWEGEKWNPNESTLLQVLVSLQSMVFCDKPFHNEPGFHGQKFKKSADDYNKRLYVETIRYGMLEWLQTSKPSVVWSEVAHQHFLSRTDDIKSIVAQWGQANLAIVDSSVLNSSMNGISEHSVEAILDTSSTSAPTKEQAAVGILHRKPLITEIKEALEKLDPSSKIESPLSTKQNQTSSVLPLRSSDLKHWAQSWTPIEPLITPLNLPGISASLPPSAGFGKPMLELQHQPPWPNTTVLDPSQLKAKLHHSFAKPASPYHFDGYMNHGYGHLPITQVPQYMQNHQQAYQTHYAHLSLQNMHTQGHNGQAAMTTKSSKVVGISKGVDVLNKDEYVVHELYKKDHDERRELRRRKRSASFRRAEFQSPPPLRIHRHYAENL